MSDNNKPKATSLVLRCCEKDMTSRNGFIWPSVGEIATAPDWRDDSECGGGLHGWLYGQGDHGSADYWSRAGAKWLVIEVVSADIRMLGGKCKFPSGKVLYVGGKEDAAAYILANEPRAATVAVIGLSLQVGESQAVTVGALGTATAGDRGTATAGYRGTATAGDRGTATAGYSGTATAGYRGTATAGDRGTATAGYRGTATAGDRGTICIRYYDDMNSRYRTVVGYVGEDGINANTAYRLDASHKFVKVES